MILILLWEPCLKVTVIKELNVVDELVRGICIFCFIGDFASLDNSIMSVYSVQVHLEFDFYLEPGKKNFRSVSSGYDMCSH